MRVDDASESVRELRPEGGCEQSSGATRACCILGRRAEQIGEGVGFYYFSWSSAEASRGVVGVLVFDTADVESGAGERVNERVFEAACGWRQIV